MKIALLGCGAKRQKMRIENNNISFVPFDESDDVIMLDINPEHNPDYVLDLDNVNAGYEKLPFEDNLLDECHMYEVLEHIGNQGDAIGFFREFSEYWRVLKPGGKLYASVPSWKSVWAFADPGHRRIIPLESLIFLNQGEYERQVGVTPMADYRYLYKADFEIEFVTYAGENGFFILKAVK